MTRASGSARASRKSTATSNLTMIINASISYSNRFISHWTSGIDDVEKLWHIHGQLLRSHNALIFMCWLCCDVNQKFINFMCACMVRMCAPKRSDAIVILLWWVFLFVFFFTLRPCLFVFSVVQKSVLVFASFAWVLCVSIIIDSNNTVQRTSPWNCQTPSWRHTMKHQIMNEMCDPNVNFKLIHFTSHVCDVTLDTLPIFFGFLWKVLVPPRTFSYNVLPISHIQQQIIWQFSIRVQPNGCCGSNVTQDSFIAWAQRLKYFPFDVQSKRSVNERKFNKYVPLSL